MIERGRCLEEEEIRTCDGPRLNSVANNPGDGHLHSGRDDDGFSLSELHNNWFIWGTPSKTISHKMSWSP